MTSDFGYNYYNHCGPTAITNIIKMYGKKYNNNIIKNNSAEDVFLTVMGSNINYKYYNPTDGTWNSSADSYIRDSFKMYNITVRTYGEYNNRAPYKINYQNTVNAFATSNRLMYIMTTRNDTRHPYTFHHLVGYGYTRIANNSGVYRAFIKVCDGLANRARYVEIDSIADGGTYWEVYF